MRLRLVQESLGVFGKFKKKFKKILMLHGVFHYSETILDMED